MYRIQELEIELDSLKSNYRIKDEQLTAITEAVAAVEDNMMAIRGRERTIRMLEHIQVPNRVVYIKQVLEEINNYLLQNRKIITKLEVKMSDGTKTVDNTRIVASLRTTVSQIESESQDLKQQITSLNSKIGDLNNTIKQKDLELEKRTEELQNKQAQLDERTRQLNTGFWTAGSYHNLLEKGVLVKAGGVLGVGKTLRLADKLERSDFNAINIRYSNLIDVGTGSKAQLVTVHPTDSYRLEQEGNGNFQVVIVDPSKFWSLSKYLVVLID
jgi:predicted  nucleic acid-binding Zn-ribbon protein